MEQQNMSARTCAPPAPRPHWPRAGPHGASHNLLHAQLPNGVEPHDWLKAPAMQPPTSLPRGQRTVAAFLHYPRETPHESYATPTGGGTDATVCMMARAVNQKMPTGVRVPFLAQWDYLDDLDGPRALKLGSVNYSFRTHFWKKLTKLQQKQWRASKVRKLASVMVDEIVERGRTGMDAFVAGDCPLEFWPELLEEAAAIAREETGRPYDVAFPPDLPPLQPRNEGEDAPEVGEFDLQHPSNAAPGRFMSLCNRKRLDAALSWAHRIKLNGATITYFQSLSSKYGDKSEAEIKELRRDGNARYGGYHGPWPSESELTTKQWAAQYPQQWAALNAAVSTAMSLRKRGGKEVVEKAADAAAVGHKEAVGRMEEIKVQQQATGSATGSANGKKGAEKQRKDAAAERPPLAWVKIRLLSGGGAVSCAVRRSPSMIRKNSAGHQVVYPGGCKTSLGGYPISFPRRGRAKGEYIVINGTKVAIMVDAYTPPPPPPASGF